MKKKVNFSSKKVLSQKGSKIDFLFWPISGLVLSETCSNKGIFDLPHREVGEIGDFRKKLQFKGLKKAIPPKNPELALAFFSLF